MVSIQWRICVRLHRPLNMSSFLQANQQEPDNLDRAMSEWDVEMRRSPAIGGGRASESSLFLSVPPLTMRVALDLSPASVFDAPATSDKSPILKNSVREL